MPGRQYTQANSRYRYGFNGKEKDGNIANDNYDYGARIYDGRIARWFSLDPLLKKYPNESNYSYVSGNPVVYQDVDGKDKWLTIYVDNQQTGQKTVIAIKTSRSNYDIVAKSVRIYTNTAAIYTDQADWHDISLNVNITINTAGKMIVSTPTEGYGRYRIHTKFELKAVAVAEIWLKVADEKLNSLAQKDADVGSGYYLTDPSAKGYGDPLGAGAKKVDIVTDAAMLLDVIGGFPSNENIGKQAEELIKKLTESGEKVEKVLQALEQIKNLKENTETGSKVAEGLKETIKAAKEEFLETKNEEKKTPYSDQRIFRNPFLMKNGDSVINGTLYPVKTKTDERKN